jgi:hypothetical protein
MEFCCSTHYHVFFFIEEVDELTDRDLLNSVSDTSMLQISKGIVMLQRSIFQTNEKFLTVSFSLRLSYFWNCLKCTILFLFLSLVGRVFQTVCYLRRKLISSLSSAEYHLPPSECVLHSCSGLGKGMETNPRYFLFFLTEFVLTDFNSSWNRTKRIFRCEIWRRS